MQRPVNLIALSHGATGRPDWWAAGMKVSQQFTNANTVGDLGASRAGRQILVARVR